MSKHTLETPPGAESEESEMMEITTSNYNLAICFWCHLDEGEVESARNNLKNWLDDDRTQLSFGKGVIGDKARVAKAVAHATPVCFPVFRQERTNDAFTTERICCENPDQETRNQIATYRREIKAVGTRIKDKNSKIALAECVEEYCTVRREAV